MTLNFKVKLEGEIIVFCLIFAITGYNIVIKFDGLSSDMDKAMLGNYTLSDLDLKMALTAKVKFFNLV